MNANMTQENDLKKVLMIAYAFPPVGGGAVQRVHNFAKFLPEFGWQPIVLAAANPLGGVVKDPSLLNELPEQVKVYRTWSFQPDKFMSFLRQKVVPNTELETWPLRSSRGSIRAVTRAYVAIRNLIDGLLFIPDRRIGWIFTALPTGIWLLRSWQADVIFSSSEPFTSHLMGYLLKRLTGKPWVADWRDPWTGIAFHRLPSQRRLILDRRMERLFLKNADRTVVVSEEMKDGFLRDHPEIDPSRLVVITNGFDPEMYSNIKPPGRKSERFTIVFTGWFSAEWILCPSFFSALKELLDDEPTMRENLQVVIVGNFGQRNHELVQQLGLSGVVQAVGPASHQESIAYQLQADVLLFTLNSILGANVAYSGKLFEYLAARKPILAVSAESAAARLIRQLEVGVVIPPDDIPAIKAAIRDLYGKYVHGQLKLQKHVPLERFDRRNLTQVLAQCLDKVILEGERA